MTKARYTGREKRPDEISPKSMIQTPLRALLYLCLLLGIIVVIGQTFTGGIVENPLEPDTSQYGEYR